MQQLQQEENLATQPAKNEGYEINAATSKQKEEDGPDYKSAASL